MPYLMIKVLTICLLTTSLIFEQLGPDYSITSMARTRMARLPWMIRTLFFQSLQNPSNNSRKQIFMDFFFLFYHGIVCCVYLIKVVYSLESPYRGDSNEYTQHTIIV